MKTVSPVLPLPVPEPVQHKTDNLDWKNIPSGKCEFEYRLAHPVTLRSHLLLFAFIVLVSILSPLLAWTLSIWLVPLFTHWLWGIAVGIVGVAWFSVHEYRRMSRTTNAIPFCFSSLRLLFAPIYIWLAVTLTSKLQGVSGAFAYYIVVAVPAVFLLSDRLATHAVHWFSAAFLLDHNTKTSWRDDWKGRFLEDPAMQEPLAGKPAKSNSSVYEQAARARHGYFAGVLWMYGATLLPCLLIQLFAANPKRETIGLQIIGGQVFALCLAAWLRSEGRLGVFRSVFTNLLHWLHYDTDPTAPWCFRSPCGPVGRRRAVALAAVGLMAIAFYSLTLPPVLYLADTLSHAAPSISPDAAIPIAPEDGFSLATIFNSISLGRWIVGGVVLLIGVPMPAIFLFLMVTILVGPVLNTYQKALQA